jgi:hypothetical protein
MVRTAGPRKRTKEKVRTNGRTNERPVSVEVPIPERITPIGATAGLPPMPLPNLGGAPPLPDLNAVPGMTVVGVDVPLEIAGQPLRSVSHSPMHPNVQVFYDQYISRCIKFDPPYQRQDDIWPLPKSAGFIHSIVNNIPMPPFYLCPIAQNSPYCYPVDGLQRMKALIRFFTNQIKIRVTLRYADDSTRERKVTWDEISKDDTYLPIRLKILNFTLNVVVLSFLPLEEQRLLFVAVNSGVPLNYDENVYCANFLARRVCHVVYGDLLHSWEGILNPKVTENRRWRGDRMAHELLLLTGIKLANGDVVTAGIQKQEGVAPNDKDEDNSLVYWKSPPLRRTERRKTAQALHGALKLAGVQHTDTDAKFRSVFDFSHFPRLKDVSDLLAGIFRDEATLGIDKSQESKTYRLQRNVLDPVAFFYKKVEANEVSVNQLRQGRDKVKAILVEYFKQKAKRNYKMSTSDAHMMTKKTNLLEELFRDKW